MEKRVAVIGICTGNALESALAHRLAANTIEIVQATQEQQKNVQQQLGLPEPMVYKAMPQLYSPGEKPFICRGKHQYREVTTREGNIIHSSWVCQCGTKLK